MSDIQILAKVGDTYITEKDVDYYIDRLREEQREHRNNPQLRKNVLDQIINIHLLSRYAENEKLDKTQVFKDSLAEARRSILTQMAVEHICRDVKVTKKEIEDYYRENPGEFESPESVSAKHILVKNEEQCLDILDSVNLGIMPFEEAAKTMSICPSRTRGGDLGAFRRGQMVKEFEDAAFGAEEDSLIGPVKTEFGWHLIYVYDKTPAHTTPLPEVEGTIREKLLKKKKDEQYNKTVERLRNRYLG